jgi:hypothetical protein
MPGGETASGAVLPVDPEFGAVIHRAEMAATPETGATASAGEGLSR